MSPQDSTYEGWSNKPTWTVNLWLSNDEGLYEMAREIVADAESNVDAAESLKDFVDSLPEVEAVYNEPASLVTDLLGWSLAHVDWFEIVNAWSES